MRKKDFTEVKQMFLESGYFISQDETYKSSTVKMLCFTSDGYKVMVSLDSVRNGNKPPIFSTHNPHTIENIKKWLEKNDPEYELMSETYEGKKIPLTFKIKNSNLPPFNATWDNFYYGGTRHPHFHYIKISESSRLDVAQVGKEFDYFLMHSGWFLPEDEELKYKNASTKLRVYDSEGYVSEISLNGLRKGRKPCRFHKYLKETSTINMKKFLKENTDYTLKDGQVYSGNSKEYIFICPLHGDFKSKWVIVQNGHKCMECYLENNRGENHPNWNPNLLDEDRLYLRKIEGYHKWRKEVYKRDRYRCVSCGKRGNNDLVAHHLDAYSWCEEKRTDVDNGVTLCELCHTAFHETYEYKNNTREQFEEWIKTRGDIEEIKKKTKIKKWKRKQKELPLRKSGVIGIHWEKRVQKWRVRPKINGQLINGGFFVDLNEAIKMKEELINNYQ